MFVKKFVNLNMTISRVISQLELNLISLYRRHTSDHHKGIMININGVLYTYFEDRGGKSSPDDRRIKVTGDYNVQ